MSERNIGMKQSHPRMARENRTIRAMMQIYCHASHGRPEGLCPECKALQDYAEARLAQCPFQENKTTCANCPVHCYTPAKREKIREVMKFAGPRMTYRHPVLALFHLLEGRRRPRVSDRKK
ncbi:MAG TPA: nitrous oxide-stimulated promoter family protein [Thermodesulfovibrionales bacterium]|nr:nitrous oxide-stimulated promoter family protein [Thermodesulfovibrionales bacterium]